MIPTKGIQEYPRKLYKTKFFSGALQLRFSRFYYIYCNARNNSFYIYFFIISHYVMNILILKCFNFKIESLFDNQEFADLGTLDPGMNSSSPVCVCVCGWVNEVLPERSIEIYYIWYFIMARSVNSLSELHDAPSRSFRTPHWQLYTVSD